MGPLSLMPSPDIHYAQTTLSLHLQGGKRKCTFCLKFTSGRQAYVSIEVGKDLQGIIHRQKQDVCAIRASVEINPNQAVQYSSRKISCHETWMLHSHCRTPTIVGIRYYPTILLVDGNQEKYWTRLKKNLRLEVDWDWLSVVVRSKSCKTIPYLTWTVGRLNASHCEGNLTWFHRIRYHYECSMPLRLTSICE